MKRRVLEKLQKVSDDHDFKPLEVDLASLILICPRYDGQSNTSTFVVEAIEEFLGRGKLPVDRTCHGFVHDAAPDANTIYLKGTFDESRVENGRWTEAGRFPDGTAKDPVKFYALEERAKGCGQWKIELSRGQKLPTGYAGKLF